MYTVGDMSIVMDDTIYITTDEAAKASGYTIDYVGQLCRSKKISCKRVSGHWFVEEESFKRYTNTGPDPKTVAIGDTGANTRVYPEDTNDIFVEDGVEYISSARAANITGYAQDYIGQLARLGEIQAKKIGRKWFAARESLLSHKKENEYTTNSGSHSKNVTENTNNTVHIHKETTSTYKSTTKIDNISDNLGVENDKDEENSAKNIHFNVRYTTETDAPLVPRINSEHTFDDNAGQSSTMPTTSSTVSDDEVKEGNHTQTTANDSVVITKKVRKPANYRSRDTFIHQKNSVRTTYDSKTNNTKHGSLRFILTLFVILTAIAGVSYFVLTNSSTGVSDTHLKQRISNYKVSTKSINALIRYIPGKTYNYERK